MMIGSNEQGASRATDIDTAKEAGKSIDASALEKIVYDVVKLYPEGCIAEQVYKSLPHIGIETVSPRFAGLLRKNLIFDTGLRRPASSGRSKRVIAVVRYEGDIGE